MRIPAAVSIALGAYACSAPVRDAPAPHATQLEIVVAPALNDALHAQPLDAWIANARRAVEGYYGRFPADDLRLVVESGSSPGVSSGVTRVEDRPTIRIAVSPSASAGDLARDWTLTHEMIHLALPQLPPAHDWLGEGTATYVEPLA